MDDRSQVVRVPETELVYWREKGEVTERQPGLFVSDWEINGRSMCHRAKTSQKGEGRLGLGVHTTVIHIEAQMQKELAFKLWLTQEQDGAEGFGRPGTPLTRRGWNN